jgi:hypothetical protein
MGSPESPIGLDSVLERAVNGATRTVVAQAESTSSRQDTNILPPPKPVLSLSAYEAFRSAVFGDDPVEQGIIIAVDAVRRLFE